MKNTVKIVLLAIFGVLASTIASAEITVRFGNQSHLTNKPHVKNNRNRYPPNLRNPSYSRPHRFDAPRAYDYNPYYNSFYGRPSTSYYYNNGNTRIIIQDNVPLGNPSINYYDYRNNNRHYNQRPKNGNHFYNKQHKRYVPK